MMEDFVAAALGARLVPVSADQSNVEFLRYGRNEFGDTVVDVRGVRPATLLEQRMWYLLVSSNNENAWPPIYTDSGLMSHPTTVQLPMDGV